MFNSNNIYSYYMNINKLLQHHKTYNFHQSSDRPTDRRTDRQTTSEGRTLVGVKITHMVEFTVVTGLAGWGKRNKSKSNGNQ